MKKNAKKKLFTLMLVIMLLSIAVVGGSLAWFTAEAEVTNTFTVGSVEVKINEDFKSPETMLPVVNMVDPESDPNFVDKDVRIQNTGKNGAYVQILLAVPSELKDADAILWKDVNAEDWGERTYIEPVEIDNCKYYVYRYRYQKELAPGNETSDTITGVYLNAALDYDNDNNCYIMDGKAIEGYSLERTIKVYVVAQAVQSKDFENAEDALNQTFGNTLPAFQ